MMFYSLCFLSSFIPRNHPRLTVPQVTKITITTVKPTKRKQRATRIIPKAKTPPPPVKSSFYKVPSRAIEKGGGFFIPGLRGPRLRYFLVTVAGTLLTLNHISATAVQASTFRISETIAVAAILGVLGTAIADTLDEMKEEAMAEKATEDNVNTFQTDGASTQLPDFSNVQSSASDTVQWATNICISLTPTTHIASFRDDVSVKSGFKVDEGINGGEAIKRVAKAQRTLYIEDSSALPPDVTFPFLPDGRWTLLVVPVNENEVVAYAASRTDEGPEFSTEERRWLEVFADRFVEGDRVEVQ